MPKCVRGMAKLRLIVFIITEGIARNPEHVHIFEAFCLKRPLNKEVRQQKENPRCRVKVILTT